MKKAVSLFLALFLSLFCLVSCSDRDEKAVGNCAGYEILYEELRYVTLSVKEKMTEGNVGLWKDPSFADANREELERRVAEELTENYLVLAACADRFPGLHPDSKELKEEIKANIDAVIEGCGGKSEYKESLKAQYMTEHLVSFQLGVALMQLRLEDEINAGTDLESTDTLLAWLDKGNFVRVQKVTVPDSAQTDSENAAQIAADLKNAATLGKAGKELSEKIRTDYAGLGISDVTSTYFRGLGTESEEEAVFSLAKVGDVGETVRSDDGYTFRVRLDDQRETVSAEQYLSSLLDKYRSKALEDYLEQYRDAAIPVFNEFGKSVDLLSIE